jgi:hypothetical protein
VCKRTVQKYMRWSHRSLPRGQKWRTFLHSHAQDVWACGFLQVTDIFFRSLFAFFIIELKRRRVVHVGVTISPTDAWVARTAPGSHSFVITMANLGLVSLVWRQQVRLRFSKHPIMYRVGNTMTTKGGPEAVQLALKFSGWMRRIQLAVLFEKFLLADRLCRLA